MTIDQLLLNIVGWNAFVDGWYVAGGIGAVFLGLLITVLAAFWIFYDAPRRMVEATMWKALSVLAAVLVLPSLVFRLAPTLAIPNLLGAVAPAAYLGLAGALLALISVALFIAGVGEPSNRCPQCGQPLDATWDRCPYCEPEPLPPPPPPPVTEPTEEILPPPEAPSPVVSARQTEILVKPVPELGWLVVTSGPRTGKEFRLGEDTSFGRDATLNEAVVDDPAMSRQHAKIRLEGKQFILHDMASKNGTFVNDRRIYRHTLKDGDKIRMGETDFSFVQVKEKPEASKPKRRRASRSRKRQKAQ